MRSTLLLMILASFISCQSQTKKFSFRSVGWTIFVPKEFAIEDSLTLYTRMERFSKPNPMPENKDYDGPLDSPYVSPEQPRESHTPTIPQNFGTSYYTPEKMLLKISPSSQWNLLASSFIATITPGSNIDSTIVENKKFMREAYNREYLPPVKKMDSTVTRKKIGKREFIKLHSETVSEKATYYIVAYTAVINGYIFNAAIYYSRPEDGDKLMKIFEDSKFE